MVIKVIRSAQECRSFSHGTDSSASGATRVEPRRLWNFELQNLCLDPSPSGGSTEIKLFSDGHFAAPDKNVSLAQVDDLFCPWSLHC